MGSSSPLEAARELVAVLEQLEALQSRRVELLAVLGGPTLGPTPADLKYVTEQLNGQPHTYEPPKAAVKAPKAGKATDVQNVLAVTKDALLEGEASRIRTSAEILADGGMGHRTEAEQAKIEDEAMDVYDANVQPASEAQRRMLFGTLGREFGVKGDDNLKHVIIELLARQHHGERIQSIREELSSPWASGLIDWLVNGDKAELKKLIAGMEIPF